VRLRTGGYLTSIFIALPNCKESRIEETKTANQQIANSKQKARGVNRKLHTENTRIKQHTASSLQI
jgi:FtsZ-binding cell division protein ZapB